MGKMVNSTFQLTHFVDRVKKACDQNEELIRLGVLGALHGCLPQVLEVAMQRAPLQLPPVEATPKRSPQRPSPLHTLGTNKSPIPSPNRRSFGTPTKSLTPSTLARSPLYASTPSSATNSPQVTVWTTFVYCSEVLGSVFI